MPFKTKRYEWQTCTKNLNNTNMQKYQKYTRKTFDKLWREGYTLHLVRQTYICKNCKINVSRKIGNQMGWVAELGHLSEKPLQVFVFPEPDSNQTYFQEAWKGFNFNKPSQAAQLTLLYSSNLGESFCEVDFEQIYMNYNYSTFCPLHSCFLLIGVDIHIFMHPEF